MHKLHILPSVFVELDINEKAFIYAAIDLKIEAEKKQAEEIKKNSRKGRRRRR